MITNIVALQREFFLKGSTRSYEYRRDSLLKLKESIKQNEAELIEALRLDLNKSESEAYLTEIGILYDEIRFHLKHLKSWTKPKRVKTPLAQFRSQSFSSPEPYGVVLIMAPWNYPVQLTLDPLVGAISAGNCVVLKPSAYSSNVSKAIAKLITQTFPPEYVAVVEGGREQNRTLLDQKFDYIFFTGSVEVGKVVMQAASKNLTPVSLELGGKSPVIVDETADIALAARRIAFGKVLNAGQTCVAPDYLLVHNSVKAEFVDKYKEALKEFFPDGDYSDFPSIINDKHFDRLMGLTKDVKQVLGGGFDRSKRFIEPTLLDEVTLQSAVMQEEIFGPLLPMIEFHDIRTCVDIICSRPKPLAFYLFTSSKQTEKLFLDLCSFGGGCINDTIIHLATPYMGFGGVGESGMGTYHGFESFKTFTHYRSIVRKRNFPDLKMRYRPYSEKKDKLIRMFLK